MTAELTSEEIVTRLLYTENFIEPAKNSFSTDNPNETLGSFLENSLADNKKEKQHSKYSFIDKSLKWDEF